MPLGDVQKTLRTLTRIDIPDEHFFPSKPTHIYIQSCGDLICIYCISRVDSEPRDIDEVIR